MTETLVDVVRTPAGLLSLGWRDGKLCRVRLGEGIGMPARRARLPRVRRWVARGFAGRADRVPLDLSSATAFERRVYAAVRRIPFGRTLTYGEVARAAGRPGAARAVGRAMAKNPLCLFIP